MLKVINKIKKINYQESGIFIALVLLWVLMFFSNPNFRNFDNFTSILRESAFLGITAVGMTFCIIGGYIDLSVGSMIALLSVFTISTVGSFGLIGMILFIIVFGLTCGLFNGLLVAKLRIPAFMATLGTLLIYRSIAYIYTGGNSIQFSEKWFTELGNGNIIKIPLPFIIFVVLVILSNIILKKTPLGKKIVAFGNSPEACRISGINIQTITISVFVIVGFFTSINAILISSRLWMATGGMKEGYEFDVIAAVVLGGTPLIGGKGSVINTAIAAIFLATVTNSMNLFFLDPFWQYIIKGFILLLAFSINSIREYFGELLKHYRIQKMIKTTLKNDK